MELDTATDELSMLAERVETHAKARGLTVVPATPIGGQGAVVHLQPDSMTAEEFLDLAAATGQRLAYLETSLFDIDDVLELDEGAADSLELEASERHRLDELREIAARFTGWPTSLQVVFASGGVVHHWVADAQWYEQFEAAIAAVLPSDDESAPRLSLAEEEALVEELAQELLALPEFRSAGNETGRRRVSRAHLASRASGSSEQLPEMLVYSATRRALDQAMVAEQRHYAGAEQRIPELVRLIAADPAYQAAHSAPARKYRVRDFLAAQADGYPPPTRILDLLLDSLTVRRQSSRGLGPMLPFESG
jgi:hypothetical protein